MVRSAMSSVLLFVLCSKSFSCYGSSSICCFIATAVESSEQSFDVEAPRRQTSSRGPFCLFFVQAALAEQHPPRRAQKPSPDSFFHALVRRRVELLNVDVSSFCIAVSTLVSPNTAVAYCAYYSLYSSSPSPWKFPSHRPASLLRRFVVVVVICLKLPIEILSFVRHHLMQFVASSSLLSHGVALLTLRFLLVNDACGNPK
jgi:hypothetical protein